MQNDAKNRPSCTLAHSLDISAARSSFKNLYIFLPSGQRCQNFAYIWKVTSNGRTEIQNINTFAISAILNFSSATKGHFSNVNILLTSLATLAKKVSYIFVKDGVIT